MTINELKQYLKNFDGQMTVAFSVWTEDGPKYYLPHFPVCNPVIMQSKSDTVAVVGFNDDCLAHTLSAEYSRRSPRKVSTRKIQA